MRKELVFMQGNALCINPKSAKKKKKNILDIRGTSVFERPGGSLYLGLKYHEDEL